MPNIDVIGLSKVFQEMYSKSIHSFPFSLKDFSFHEYSYVSTACLFLSSLSWQLLLAPTTFLNKELVWTIRKNL